MTGARDPDQLKRAVLTGLTAHEAVDAFLAIPRTTLQDGLLEKAPPPPTDTDRALIEAYTEWKDARRIWRKTGSHTARRRAEKAERALDAALAAWVDSK